VFPYVEHPKWTIGAHTIYAFGLLACAAILVGIAVVVLRAPRIGLDREETFSLVVWTVVWGFIGSHVFSAAAYFPSLVRQDPFELLRLWGSMSSFGGLIGGIGGAALLMKRRQFSAAEIVRFIDNVAFAFPFAWIFGRAGCSLAHDHLGIESRHWLAVAFPDGPRFDLGLLELLYTLIIAGIFLFLDRRRWPDGFFVGLFFTLYGPVRFAMDFLRVDEARYLGWTPSQYLSLAAALAGITILRRGAVCRSRYGGPAGSGDRVRR
jgi:phosphatidylglycerol:prolipoprotein diacylglycerol transferase